MQVAHKWACKHCCCSPRDAGHLVDPPDALAVLEQLLQGKPAPPRGLEEDEGAAAATTTMGGLPPRVVGYDGRNLLVGAPASPAGSGVIGRSSSRPGSARSRPGSARAASPSVTAPAASSPRSIISGLGASGRPMSAGGATRGKKAPPPFESNYTQVVFTMSPLKGGGSRRECVGLRGEGR